MKGDGSATFFFEILASEDQKTVEDDSYIKSKDSPGENSSKGKKKSKTAKSKSKAKKPSSSNPGPGGEQPKIDIDEMMRESQKLPPGQKRKYRTLDTMTLISGTGLYLVLVLVFNAEFFKTSFVTLIYSLFIYLYSGSYM